MQLNFNRSDALTVGLELELQIVDAHSGMLSPSSPSIWTFLQASPLAKHFALEATLSALEINSSVHVQADAMGEEVLALARQLREIAAALSLDVRGGGTHVAQFWNDRILSPTDRAQVLADRFGFLPKRFSTYGMHVHVGMPSGDDALRVGAVLQGLVPVFIALSAASPFLQLHDTGFCASRPLEPLVYPHGGPMPNLASWAEFEALAEVLFSTELASSLKDIYWDVRPKPEFGTVEVRVFDTPLSIHKAVALAAFTRGCAGLALNGILRLGDAPYAAHADRVSRFLACRDGLNARLIDPFTRNWLPVRDLVTRLFDLIGQHPVHALDMAHIERLRSHCAHVQDCDRMRDEQKRCQVIGESPEATTVGLAPYSARMRELLFEPLG